MGDRLSTWRRFKMSFIASLLLILAGATALVPTVRRSGVMGVVPDLALVLVFDPDRPYAHSALETLARETSGRARLRLSSRVVIELEKRIRAGTLSDRALRTLVTRCLRDDASTPPVLIPRSGSAAALLGAIPADAIDTLRLPAVAGMSEHLIVRARTRWPAGVPMRIEVNAGAWRGLPDPSTHATLSLAGARSPLWTDRNAASPLNLPHGWGEWRDHAVTLPTTDTPIHLAASIAHTHADNQPAQTRTWRLNVSPTRTNTIDEIVPPFSSPAFDDAITRVTATASPFTRSVQLDLTPIERELTLNPSATLGVRIELLYAGGTVATGRAWWNRRFLADHFVGDLDALRETQRTGSLRKVWTSVVALDSTFVGPLPSWGGEGWTVRITGDPIVALDDIDAATCWRGEITIPLAPPPALGGIDSDAH